MQIHQKSISASGDQQSPDNKGKLQGRAPAAPCQINIQKEDSQEQKKQDPDYCCLQEIFFKGFEIASHYVAFFASYHLEKDIVHTCQGSSDRDHRQTADQGHQIQNHQIRNRGKSFHKTAFRIK